ncbi:Drug/metabolite transporter [Corchorus olitorius]|uniref:WAT1-related protein n=1 Tax=Corchorus olitorius TaxID=93759 RepID=A0A1R3JB39_9ROSI|nr:Drug/metabolite transporter [Corchorus olitorius]
MEWGSLGQNLYLQSLVYTSATFITAMINLAPAVTFILAILFKMEKLAIGTAAGKAKVLGTLVGISGAMVFTFYKGAEINIWSTNINILPHHEQAAGSTTSVHGGNFILGAFLGLLSCVSFAMWLIIQAKMTAKFPYLCTTTALMCVTGSIQAIAFAFLRERDLTQWKLGWNIRLLASAFAGITGSAIMIFLVSWAVRLKGPLYASVFNPLGLVFVAIAGSLMLDEKLHLGSILGGILIVCGLYLVLWGKAKEMKQNTQLIPTTTDDQSKGTKEDGQIENK